jgi:hypothetical protein
MYFQVYNVNTPKNIIIENNTLVFEDSNCKIIYDLWANGGNFSFKIFNKTGDNIYIHMDESFYTRNGMANNYFNNSIVTNSRFSSISNSTTVSNYSTNSSQKSYSASKAITGYNSFDLLQTNKLIKSNSKGISNTFGVSDTFQSSSGFGNSITTIEEKIVIIPRNSAKIIYGKLINDSYLSFNELKKYPKNHEKYSIQFNSENTPISFSNIISYSLNKDDKLIKVYNDFYVSEITNYNGEDIIKSINKNKEGRFIRPYNYFTVGAPDRFYVKLQTQY